MVEAKKTTQETTTQAPKMAILGVDVSSLGINAEDFGNLETKILLAIKKGKTLQDYITKGYVQTAVFYATHRIKGGWPTTDRAFNEGMDAKIKKQLKKLLTIESGDPTTLGLAYRVSFDLIKNTRNDMDLPVLKGTTDQYGPVPESTSGNKFSLSLD